MFKAERSGGNYGFGTKEIQVGVDVCGCSLGVGVRLRH